MEFVVYRRCKSLVRHPNLSGDQACYTIYVRYFLEPSDNLPPERRVVAMASLGAANGAGLVLGPALAAQLTHFGLEAPLYLTALLPALGLAVLWKFLPATPPVGARPGQLPRLLDPRLRRPMVAAFTALFTVAVGQIVVGLTDGLCYKSTSHCNALLS